MCVRVRARTCVCVFNRGLLCEERSVYVCVALIECDGGFLCKGKGVCACRVGGGEFAVWPTD